MFMQDIQSAFSSNHIISCSVAKSCSTLLRPRALRNQSHPENNREGRRAEAADPGPRLRGRSEGEGRGGGQKAGSAWHLEAAGTCAQLVAGLRRPGNVIVTFVCLLALHEGFTPQSLPLLFST